MLIELGDWRVDILEEHLEELTWLWPARQAALTSSDHELWSFQRLQDRIVAHTDALALAGKAAVPLLAGELEGDEDAALAAAYALLLSSDPSATGIVRDAFWSGEGDGWRGIVEALALAPFEAAGPALEGTVPGGPLRAAVGATRVLARHGREPDAPDLNALDLDAGLRHEDARVREEAWELVALTRSSPDPKSYANAMRDAKPEIRTAALVAGAWCGERGALLVCRQLVDEAPGDHVGAARLLAVLGTGEDRARLSALVDRDELGPERFEWIARYGDPGLVERLLTALADPDPVSAAAAADAFERMTGLDCTTGERVVVPPDTPNDRDGDANDDGDNDLAAAFAEEVPVPDQARAGEMWSEVSAELSGAERISRGRDLSEIAAPYAELDMRARADAFMRASHRGAETGLVDFLRTTAP